MNTTMLNVASVAAGLFFCAWPLRMNQSGLSAAGALFAYASIAFATAVCGLALVPGAWPELRGRALSIGLQAGLLNIIGVLAFTYMLSHATRQEAPRQILIAIITQTTLNSAWAAYQAGAVEPRLLLGLGTALATVFLLR
jgi:hypothetical protein